MEKLVNVSTKDGTERVGAYIVLRHNPPFTASVVNTSVNTAEFIVKGENGTDKKE